MFEHLFDRIDAAFTALGTSDTYADTARGVLIFRNLTPEQIGALMSTPLPAPVETAEIAAPGSDAIANTIASAALDVPPWVDVEPAATMPGAQIALGADSPQAGDNGTGADSDAAVPGAAITATSIIPRAPKGKR